MGWTWKVWIYNVAESPRNEEDKIPECLNEENKKKLGEWEFWEKRGKCEAVDD